MLQFAEVQTRSSNYSQTSQVGCTASATLFSSFECFRRTFSYYMLPLWYRSRQHPSPCEESWEFVRPAELPIRKATYTPSRRVSTPFLLISSCQRQSCKLCNSFRDPDSQQRSGKPARLTLLRDGWSCLKTGPDVLQQLHVCSQ